MSYNWGAFVTKQFRTATSPVWATIDPLSAGLRPGDYGPIVNGGFTRYGNLGIALATSTAQAEGNYNFQTSSVHKQESTLAASFVFIDPENGLEVKGGTQITYTFTKTESATSNMPTAYSVAYSNAIAAVEYPGAYETLYGAAQQAGWLNSDGTVKEGFCMVTATIRIAAGLFYGSESDSSTLTIQGSVQGMEDFMNGQVGGGYGDSSVDSGLYGFVWPSAGVTDNSGKNVVSTNNMRTIAVELASFDHYMPGRGSGHIVYPYL